MAWSSGLSLRCCQLTTLFSELSLTCNLIIMMVLCCGLFQFFVGTYCTVNRRDLKVRRGKVWNLCFPQKKVMFFCLFLKMPIFFCFFCTVLRPRLEGRVGERGSPHSTARTRSTFSVFCGKERARTHSRERGGAAGRSWSWRRAKREDRFVVTVSSVSLMRTHFTFYPNATMTMSSVFLYDDWSYWFWDGCFLQLSLKFSATRIIAISDEIK
jgi:hypothetical protein